MSGFAALLVPNDAAAAVSDAAWVAAMLDAERALARVEAMLGLIPEAAADAIDEACAQSYDAAEIADSGRSAGNPAEPLVRDVRARVGAASPYVHFGATSQDIVDTAAMLVSRAAVAHVHTAVADIANACARLAEQHRDTPAAARTLQQQAVPTTFGARAAGWLVSVLDAREALDALRYPAQLGGAAGTLAPFATRGVEVLEAFARDLRLDVPTVPWHTHRGPVARIANALEAVARACAKIGLDVVLLAQTEVAEVAEAEGGVSSTMPHKRNPARATLARACAQLVHANASILTSGEHELERAAGAWQAEWPALSSALAFATGAAANAAACVDGLKIDAARMRSNATASLMSERDAFVEQGLIAAGDEAYLGSAGAFVDRALARYRESA